MKLHLKLRILTVLFISFIGCQTPELPSIEYSQYQHEATYSFENGSLSIYLENPLMCPLRVWIQSTDPDIHSTFDGINPILVLKESDTTLQYQIEGDSMTKIHFASRLGDPSKKIDPIKVGLPFPKGRAYQIIQGNNSEPTHNSEWSRYAIDFSMNVNDTICAATDGYVVGVVEAYTEGGPGKEWRPFCNFMTIFEPQSGVFTQYVHLKHQGSLFNVGDFVRTGDAIGLSGKTGQTNIPHLHFNCLIPENSNDGLKSVAIEFVEGFRGLDLERGEIVAK